MAARHIACLLWGFLLSLIGQGQCTFGGNSLTTLSPTGAGYSASNAIRGGYYVLVNVCSGASYTFSTCGDPDFDTQITLFNNATTAVIGYNDDFAGCSPQSSITWVANFTGVVRALVNQFNCGNTGASLQTTLTVSQTTACGTVVFPANDACAGSIAISCGQTITGSTSDASAEAATGTCGNATSPTEWYSFAGNGQSITASLCGSGYDSYISVLSGTCGALTCVASNDDAGACSPQSQVTFTSVIGTTYYIRVGGYGTNAGAYTLALTCASLSANDGCAGALPIACGQTIAGSTADASPEAMVAGCGNATAPSEWYVFTGTGQYVTASLCGSAYDTQMSVVTGTCGGTYTCIGFNDDFCGLQSQVGFASITGTTYYIRVSGYTTSSGNYSLALTCSTPPANDGCSGAIAVACGQTITGSTTDAFPEATAAGCGNATAPSEWYSFVGTGQLTTIDLCASSYDTQVSVYSGTCAGGLSCVAFNDDFLGCGLRSKVTFSAVTGVTYFVRVGGFGTASGNYSMTVTCVTETGNDPCTGALPIACGATVTGSTASMNIDAIPAGCGISNSSGAWYSLVGNGQMITLNTCTATSYDTQISVFNGTCASLSCIATNDQFCGNQSQVTFLSTVGMTYYVLVHGYNATGSFSLAMTCAPYVPTPQDCQGANTVCNDQQFNGNSSGYGVTQEVNSTNAGCLTIEHQSSWYIFSPTTTGVISFTINPTPIVDYDFAIWGPYSSVACPPSGTPMRCSWSALSAPTGLGNGATDLTEGAAGDAWVAPITVGASDINQVYIMLLDNFSQSTTPFVFDWSLSGVVLDCTIQLPVSYLKWSGQTRGAVNELEWVTATEIMNELFVIERSMDNLHFEPIASVAGNGTTQTTHAYNWTDERPMPGVNYYRLKQIDWNGQSHYSDIIAIDRAVHFTLAPNPAQDQVRIWLNQESAPSSSIVMTDMCGRVVYQKSVVDQKNTPLEIPLNSYQPGAYIVTLRDRDGRILQHARLVVE
jgi:Secretion system C-terminal sorting domain